MKEIIKISVYLSMICIIAGTSLSITNYFTTKKIVSQKIKSEEAGFREVLPNAFHFESMDSFSKKGFDQSGNIAGYVLKIRTTGYSGEIVALVGIDRDFRIMGVKILTQNETPGLGAKIIEKNFLAQFIGKPSEKIFLKVDNKDGEIDAITSATISSRAITNGIRRIIDEFKEKIERAYKRNY